MTTKISWLCLGKLVETTTIQYQDILHWACTPFLKTLSAHKSTHVIPFILLLSFT